MALYQKNGQEKVMIYLLMIDSGEDRRKFVILYETYRHFMMKIALDILKDAYLAKMPYMKRL